MSTVTEHERALIGSLMVDPTQCLRVQAVVDPSDFADEGLGRIYSSLLSAHAAGSPISDRVWMLAYLRAAKLWGKGSVVDHKWLDETLRLGVVSHNAPYYASEIAKAARLRRMAVAAATLHDEAIKVGANPDSLAEWMRCQLDHGRAHAAARKFGDIVNDTVDALATNGDRPIGTMTGIFELDDMIGAWQAGELVILAARPSIGKTAMAMQIASHAARRNKAALFISLEMGARELSLRRLAADAGIDGQELRRGIVSHATLSQVVGLRGRYDDWPLYVYSPPRATLAQIMAVSRLQNIVSPISLIAVDYISLIRAADSRMDRRDQISEISKGLKQLAKEIHCPILVLSQLNRHAEGEVPNLSMLRESGAIEEDADIVIFLHSEQERSSTTRDIVLIVAKNRNGQVGRRSIRWNPKQCQFSTPAQGEPFDPDSFI